MKTPQFHINPVQPQDQERVAEIFKRAGEAFHLLDTKVISRSDDIICSYAESRTFDFGMGAWLMGNQIVIGFDPGKGATERFHEVFALVVMQLRTAFGERLANASPENYVQVPHTLPQTDASRAIYRTLLASRK